ncbi:MAG: threonine/serine dehydratase [Myxococcales bacterium]|nr:threonine/serine dehydratase [Myxococcales bacterium]
MTAWPLSFAELDAARERLRPFLTQTAVRNYGVLDACIGHDLEIWVKHENHQPTGSFKARNGLSATTALDSEARGRGVIAASRGNHGQGVALAGKLLNVQTTICVPEGNSPSKNQAMRSFGATLVEEGKDYDESLAVALELASKRGLTVVHSTNDPTVLAGAATITAELLEQAPNLDAIVVAIGGGSQAVGAITAVRQKNPKIRVFGVQAAAASAIHDGYHAREPRSTESADTFADGLATRHCYDLTFPALCEGLEDFATVTEAEIAEAIRLYIGSGCGLAEGAGSAGLAGLQKLAPRLTGKRVGVILSGGNIDADILRKVLSPDFA